MQELARVRLENEMDLILAHKRAMKLGELAGLSLPAQTTFATAVSEVARTTCEHGRCGILVLGIESDRRERYIVASLQNEHGNERQREGLEFAKRLVNKYQVSEGSHGSSIELYYAIAGTMRIDIHKLDEWRQAFRNEPPVSPYEELKRRNDQLRELSERVQKSEAQYKTLTNALPLIIFSLNAAGELVYANEWLTTYTGETTESLNRSRWKETVHPDDYDSFSLLPRTGLTRGATTMRLQVRLRQGGGGEWIWHQATLTPFGDERAELQYWIGYMADIHAQKIVEETLKDNIELKEAQEQLRTNQGQLEATIAELNRSNQELQQFAYVASHDLQEPVRKVLYYSDYLVDRYGGRLDERGLSYLKNMQGAAHRMRRLIHDILSFSQINHGDTQFGPVDLNKVATEAVLDLELVVRDKEAVVHFDPLPQVTGDTAMLCQLFSNIIGNSLKYARPGTKPEITVSAQEEEGMQVVSFRDNGIGFNAKYLPRLFGLFQRLQHHSDYEGTGIGLAICKKIMDLHGGRIWADSEEGTGSTFHVSFPVTP